jgi:hypothetical protein
LNLLAGRYVRNTSCMISRRFSYIELPPFSGINIRMIVYTISRKKKSGDFAGKEPPGGERAARQGNVIKLS